MARLDATPRCHKWIDKPISHRNQSFDLHCKLINWFLYEMQPWVDMVKALDLQIISNCFKSFQSAITCSKLTAEKIEQGVKNVQS